MLSRIAPPGALLLILSLTVGCGGGAEKGDTTPVKHDDAGLIANLVSEVGDRSGAGLAQLFSSKPSAAELKKYPTMTYTVDGKAKVEGATATATVKMKSNANEKDLGSKEWTFAKEGNDWKIKSAPMP